MPISWNPLFTINKPDNTPYHSAVQKNLLVKNFKRIFDVFYGDVSSVKRVRYQCAHNYHLCIGNDDRRKELRTLIEHHTGTHSGLIDIPMRIALKCYNTASTLAIFLPLLMREFSYSLFAKGAAGKVSAVFIGIPGIIVATVLLLADTAIRAIAYALFTPLKALISVAAALILAPFCAAIESISLWQKKRLLTRDALSLPFEYPANPKLPPLEIKQKLENSIGHITQVLIRKNRDDTSAKLNAQATSDSTANQSYLAFYHNDSNLHHAQPYFILSIDDITENCAAFRALLELDLFNILSAREPDEEQQHAIPSDHQSDMSQPLLAQKKHRLCLWLEQNRVSLQKSDQLFDRDKKLQQYPQQEVY